MTNEVVSQCGQAIGSSVSPTKFNRYILALDISNFLQALTERDYLECIAFWRSAVEERNDRQRSLLRSRGERQRPAAPLATDRNPRLPILIAICPAPRDHAHCKICQTLSRPTRRVCGTLSGQWASACGPKADIPFSDSRGSIRV